MCNKCTKKVINCARLLPVSLKSNNLLGFILLFVTVQHKHMLINYRSDGRVIPKTRLYSCALGVTRGMRNLCEHRVV